MLYENNHKKGNNNDSSNIALESHQEKYDIPKKRKTAEVFIC